MLRTLQTGPLNGWDVMQRIRSATGGILVVTPGALYPALHRHEERGMVSAEWGASDNNRRAKFYQLTVKGRKQLQSERATWSRFSGAVEALLRDA